MLKTERPFGFRVPPGFWWLQKVTKGRPGIWFGNSLAENFVSIGKKKFGMQSVRPAKILKSSLDYPATPSLHTEANTSLTRNDERKTPCKSNLFTPAQRSANPDH
jgi:hypothetical protein